jgi:ferrous iron transport protein B
MSHGLDASLTPLDERNVLLVGSPNSGKTTLYNWLTGSKFKTVNYPGATIEYSLGSLQSELAAKVDMKPISVVDTPGIYSLEPQSDDEKVTVGILKHSHHIKYNSVLLIIDATQMNRQLLLAKHLIQPNTHVIVVLTMADLVAKDKQQLNVIEIKKYLGVDHVVLFDGVLGKGLIEIVALLKNTPQKPAYYLESKYSEEQKIGDLKGISHFLKEKAFMKEKVEAAQAAIQTQTQLEFTLKIDQWLLHPVLGYVFFFALMTLFFASVYWWAAPLMDLIDGGMAWAIDFTKAQVPGLFGEFLGDGLLAAINGVVIFVPQIFVLFIGIGLFENTGYLSRVAALIDGPLKKVGLGGRSFVPMLSGFACAIPAIMATRNITSRKERMIAQFTIPFMSCSARLPVYALLIGFLIAGHAVSSLMGGFIMAALYFGSIVVGSVASAILSKIIQSQQSSRLMLDLPLYRRPRFRTIFRQSLDKSISFVKKAGPIIIGLSVVLWVATTFPKAAEGTPEDQAPPSYAMQVSEAIAPVFKPLGLDGRVGFAYVASFAAREVFVSSLALSLNAQVDENDEENTTPILEKMAQAKFADGTPIFTVASVVGIFIFFMIAMQCLTTVGVLKKENGSWLWTGLQLVGSNAVAYLLAVIAVQSLKAFGL